ncbi:MAG TPA: hypothetical protein VIN08_21515 [Ohtaekwangia sp.]|uniref:hypothetical protein n=1 Tax=Ohtaekwangia sp. TaxID=2066019 RepID=UPI002F9361A2
MQEPGKFTPAQSQSSADIADLIRRYRNELIKDFLDERNLVAYVAEHYKLVELSKVKIEFMKRDLKNLLTDPIDAELYEPIIRSFQQTGNAEFTEDDSRLFYREIDRLIKKYIYAS